MQKKCWMLSVSVLISLTRSGRIWRRLEKWLRKKSRNFRTVSAQYVHVFNIGNQIHLVHESIEQYLKYLCNNKPNGTFYFNFSSSHVWNCVSIFLESNLQFVFKCNRIFLVEYRNRMTGSRESKNCCRGLMKYQRTTRKSWDKRRSEWAKSTDFWRLLKQYTVYTCIQAYLYVY